MTGVAAGLGAIVLLATLRAVRHLAWSHSSGDFQHAVARATFARRIVVLAICGIVVTVATVVLKRFLPGRGGRFSNDRSDGRIGRSPSLTKRADNSVRSRARTCRRPRSPRDSRASPARRISFATSPTLGALTTAGTSP